MKTAKCKIKGISPYSQSSFYKCDKLEKESAADFEASTWRERLHVDDKENVFIPPMAFKNCLSEAAKYLSIQIPGKGKSTYTKHFEAGVLVIEPMILAVKKSEVQGEWLFVPADGRRGGSKRVEKCFPVIHKWEGEIEFMIVDETVTRDVFRKVLDEAGRFIGIGRFRPRNNGYYGRFIVEAMDWK